MNPETSYQTLMVRQVDGHVSVDRATVPSGTYLDWQGPEGTTAEIEFLQESPFGSVTKVSQGQALSATNPGVFPYRCSLRQGDTVLGSDSPEDGWGGEVEVTGKGGGSTS